MVVDTAADYARMPHSLYQEKFADIPLTALKVVLWTYTGERLDVSGEMQCDVVYKNKRYSLPVLVVNYSGKPSLPGKNWLSLIKLAWGEMSLVKTRPVRRVNYKLFCQNIMICSATVMQA